jgi:hypothetical protein
MPRCERPWNSDGGGREGGRKTRLSQGILPGGSQLLVKRGDLQIAHTLSLDSATEKILAAPCVADTAGRHRAAGINLASWALWAILRTYTTEQIARGRGGVRPSAARRSRPRPQPGRPEVTCD